MVCLEVRPKFPSSIPEEIASKIPTLHYLALYPGRSGDSDWWHISRSEKPDEHPHLQNDSRCPKDKK